MDKREILIFFHILGGFMIAGGAGADTVLGFIGARTPSVRVIAATAHAQIMTTRILIIPGALILIAAGSWLVADYGLYDFDEGWISGGYAIWILSVLVGSLYLGPHAVKLRDRARVLRNEGMEESEQLRIQAAARPVMLAALALDALLVVAIYLMVTRPGA